MKRLLRTVLNERSALLGGLTLAAAFFAVLVLAQALALGLARPQVPTLILAAALIVMSAIDMATFRLPNILTLPLAALGCALHWQVDDPLPGWHVLSAVIGYGAFWLFGWIYERVRGHAGLGLGDAKLLAAAGAWLGLEELPSVVLIASLSGLAVAIVALASGRAIDGKTRLPFGPFLALGFWIVWCVGPLM